MKLMASPCSAQCKAASEPLMSLYDSCKFKEAIDASRMALKADPDCPILALILAGSLYKDGQARRALDQARAGIKAHPKTADFYFAAGHALKELDLPGQAVQMYEQAIEIAGDVSRLYTSLAFALYDEGRETESVQSAKRACEIAPDSRNAHFYAADLLFTLGRTDEAAKYSQAAVKLSPGDEESYLILTMSLLFLNRPGELLKHASEFAESCCDMPFAVMSRSVAKMVNGNIKGAYEDIGLAKQADHVGHMRYITEDIPEDPKEARRKVYEAFALSMNEETDQLMPRLEMHENAPDKSGKPKGDDEYTYVSWLGPLLHAPESGAIYDDYDYDYDYDLERALKDTDRRLKSSKSHSLLNDKGIILVKMSRLRAAVSAFEAALRIRPGSHEVLANMAHALLLLGDPAGSLEAAEQSLLAGRSESALLAKACALMGAKRHGEAIGAFEGILSDDPNCAPAYGGMGQAFARLGRLAESIDAYDMSIAIDPESKVAHEEKGAALVLADRLKEAIACYDRSIEIDPNYVLAHYDKGVALMSMGDKDGAKQEFDIASEIAPGLLDEYRR